MIPSCFLVWLGTERARSSTGGRAQLGPCWGGGLLSARGYSWAESFQMLPSSEVAIRLLGTPGPTDPAAELEVGDDFGNTSHLGC